MFSAQEFNNRRDNLVNELGKGIIILPSYSDRIMSNDVHYEFRQQTDFMYFTGFPEPDSIAIIENKKDETIYHLFVPKRDEEFEIWNGRRYGIKGAEEIFGADKAHVNDDFEEVLNELIVEYETIYLNMNENEEIDNIVLEAMKKGIKNREVKGRGPVTLENPINEIHKLRIIKSSNEIDLIRKSASISVAAMEQGIAVTKPGLTERDVESVIEYYFAKNGADRPAYPSIVGSGVNATILHYIENTDELIDGELLLVDAGAEYKGYAADITRTWPINGKFSEVQRRVYNIVLNTQKHVIDMIKPGETLQNLQDTAIEMLSKGLVDLGLLKGDLDEIIEEEEYKRFFMHGIGHWLGIDTHDTSKIDKEFSFKPGMYFTVEPGIYIPDEDDIPEEYRGIGIRIEDDILVTEDGYENLTKDVVKEIEEVESLVGTKNMP